MKGEILFLIIVLIHLVPLAGCAPSQSALAGPSYDCIDKLAALMKSRPDLSHLTTLDGQRVLLGDFYRLSWNASPLGELPEKFYHWKHEIKWVRARTAGKIISHQIRIYHNYLSTCRPDRPDPGKTHGDVAEFYNEQGEFMGLAVYAGKGLYCPLPYADYSGAGNVMRRHMQNRHRSNQ
jgi:hypothetical protein